MLDYIDRQLGRVFEWGESKFWKESVVVTVFLVVTGGTVLGIFMFILNKIFNIL